MNNNAAGQPERADIATLESLRSRLMPLVYNVEALKHDIATKQNTPPDWPSIQRSIAALSTALTSIQALINEDPETMNILRSLHPFPITPFPAADPTFAGLADTIIRKRPNPHEEDWVLDRLAKAAEFAHVPEEWGITPKKSTESKGEDPKGEPEGTPSVRRTKGNLNEDELAEVWTFASEVVTDILENLNPDEGSEASESKDTAMGDAPDPQGSNVGDAKESELPLPMMGLGDLLRFMTVGRV